MSSLNGSTDDTKKKKQQHLQVDRSSTFIYDLILWIFTFVMDIFFREIRSRGSYRIPRRGAVIFVAAPHANQFIDPLILMREARREAGRRISFLIAEKSMRRPFVGFMARAIAAIPVMRAQDLTKSHPGAISLHDRSHPLQITGSGTKFSELKPGMSLVLPDEIGTAEIASIESDTEITLKREFRGLRALELLEVPGGTPFKTAPKVDQSWVYEKVFERIEEGGCIGIYPEGGSHDRPDLLPLKAGVAVMALGALQKDPNANLKIIPCGMNYFHPHKFRSRAVIEFGNPLIVPQTLVEKYADPVTRRDAIKGLLDMIYHALLSVTVNTPDFETLQVVQAARRLYKPAHRRLPLPKVVELNRRFVEGYNHFKDDPRVVKLRKDILQYNQRLHALGIRDHQVENARYDPFNVLGILIYRSLKVTLLGLGALPGILLFGPVFIATKVISHRKAKEALAASTVKLRGRDIIATWKFLVALGLVPLLYFVYGCITAYYARKWDVFGWGYDSRSYLLLIPLFHFIIFPTISFAALRFGEIGMDIYKSMPPLLFSLNPSNRGALARLKRTRETLSAELTQLINTLGPEIFPDFDASRVIASSDLPIAQPPSPHHVRRRSSQSTEDGLTSPIGSGVTGFTPLDLPRGEKFENLADVQIFASRPPSRSGRRSRSTSFKDGVSVERLSGFTSAGMADEPEQIEGTQEGFEEMTRRIRGGLAARRKERVSISEGSANGKKEQ